MPSAYNPLIQDRTLEFILYDMLQIERLCELPHFEDHGRETFDMFMGACRRFAREVLFDSYRPMDQEGAFYQDGRVQTHPLMETIYPQFAELGLLNASRPYEVDGQQLPEVVLMAATAYLAAANLSAHGFGALTSGAAHLIETFGSPELKKTYMEPMYAGCWTGTMALTEPQAGSGLNDVQTRATPTEEGHYLIRGSKVFISGGDNSFTENVVHLALARIDGAPAGTKGISLFVVPRLRAEAGKLVDNDVTTAGTFHKLGWRGIPSIALNFGEENACHGYLVGEPHRGLSYMFQMMNGARLGIGLNGVATAMVAYEEALEYAKNRPQGRKFGHPASSPVVNIIEHADVRRMLLKQKSVAEGALALLLTITCFADVAAQSQDDLERRHAEQLLELLTPICKTFPAEKGFESNALAVQVLGGYGYTSEYLPESYLRDQKLNSIHEGTTGIQSIDLLGRKVLGTGGASLESFASEVKKATEAAKAAGVDARYSAQLEEALGVLAATTATLGQKAQAEPEVAFQHSADYLEMFGTITVAWQWLCMATTAQSKLKAGHHDEAFMRGKLAAAQYFFENELPRALALAPIITGFGGSFLEMQAEWF